MEQEKIILPEKIYYVSSPDDQTALVAMDVKVRNGGIEWFDTVKYRNMLILEILDPNPRNFVFSRKDGSPARTYTLVPMDLEIYNVKVKPRLVNSREFASREELLAAFEETKKDAW